MSSEPQLFKVDPESKSAHPVGEIDFADAGFRERRDIQEWIDANPAILGDDLLIIGKEFTGFDKTRERPDLIAVDQDGNIVVIELKRDDSGSNTHWQAIKYASYFQHASPDEIVHMFAEYRETSEEDAAKVLGQHLDTGNLDDLNRDQRIILASHRFAPEVTSAVAWLNEKGSRDNLITCVRLTPYRDSDSVYIQASTILPIPGIEQVAVSGSHPGSSGREYQNKNDEVTRYLRGAAAATLRTIRDDLRPDRRSRWAGGSENDRYYRLWYSRQPWGNWQLSFRLRLLTDSSDESLRVHVYIGCQRTELMKRADLSDENVEDLKSSLHGLLLADDQHAYDNGTRFGVGVWLAGKALDQPLEDAIAKTLRLVIEKATPAVDDFFEAARPGAEE